MTKLTREQQMNSLRQQIRLYEFSDAPACMIDKLKKRLQELEDQDV